MPPKDRTRPDPDFVETILERFLHDFPAAILLGGWAAYLRTEADKSHDIDVIVDHVTLGLLASRYQLAASSHVGGRKFQLELDGVEVDIYPVYQSKLGKHLRIPVESLAEHTELVQGHLTLTREGLFVAKMAALLDRPDSLPGDKDRREMWQLLARGQGPMEFQTVSQILAKAGWAPEQQAELLERTFSFLDETDTLRPHERPSLRRMCASALAAVHSPRGQEPTPPGHGQS